MPDPSDPTGIATITRFFERDAHGRITKITEPNPAGGANFVTLMEYNDQGFLTKVTNPDGTFRTAVYDQTTNTLTSASGNTTSWAYDNLGRTNKATGDYEEYAWDHRNRLTAVTFHAAGGSVTQVIEYRYDAFDRLIA